MNDDEGNESIISIPQSDNITRPKSQALTRSFQGNPRYINFYNRFVIETFQSDGNYIETNLEGSYITNDSQVYYYPDVQGVDHNVDVNIPGSYWSPSEKEQFFNLLSKYSIHNIDIIVEGITTKNKFEILNYYELLKSKLNDLKRGNHKHNHDERIMLKSYKVTKIIDRSTTRSNNKQTIKTYKVHFPQVPTRRLISYHSIPSAYEVSEDLIKFEENQSLLINIKEKKKINDENRRYKRNFNMYVDSEEEEEEGGLFNIEMMNQIFDKIYRNQTILETSNDKVSLGFTSYVLLEEIIKTLIRKIMINIINSSGHEREITVNDVFESIIKLNIADEKINKFHYWQGIIERLLPIVSVNEPGIKGDFWNQYPDEIVSSFLIYGMSHQTYFESFMNKDTGDIFTSTNPIDKFLEKKPIAKINHNKINVKDENDPDESFHISELNQSNFKRRRLNKRNHKGITDQLIDQYDKEIEKFDYYESKMYERGLISYLTGKKEKSLSQVKSQSQSQSVDDDEEEVVDDEGLLILQEWELQDSEQKEEEEYLNSLKFKGGPTNIEEEIIESNKEAEAEEVPNENENEIQLGASEGVTTEGDGQIPSNSLLYQIPISLSNRFKFEFANYTYEEE
ncbi:hypothetical protein DFJ63DRAFT_311609 [Scheffersomyces coipomensis]|uniref:uncharacterized protein n=1 Tax=Scheffersomyces coipomensis TaxID=1788519 RepID=UPI00315D6D58